MTNERTVESKVEVKKKADINLLLPSSLVMGLKKSPLNPTLRAAALSKFGIPIPDNKKTYKAIEEWVAETIDPATVKTVPHKNDYAFAIEVHVSELRRGKAYWTAEADGHCEYSLEVGDMEEIVSQLAEGSLSFDQAVRECRAKLYDMANDDPPELNEDEYEYSDNEMIDSDDFTCEVNTNLLKRRVHQYIALHHPNIPLPALPPP